MKHRTHMFPVALSVDLAYAAHVLRSIAQGFAPVTRRRFRAIALCYGKWA